MSADPSTDSNNALLMPIFDKIRLSHLLEAAVQKTYTELYTMADVLPGKSSQERKIELIKFACRARQLFIRILAIVKWLATTGRVTACEDIQNFLEVRGQLIRETSNTLAQLAREKLPGARIPNFPVTDAIDTLTLGTINFLPKRIAEITTGFTPATEKERQQILPRLQQILIARISTSELPIQFTNVTIKNGLVILGVDGEFEVRLGVVNDNQSSPWHVYQTKLFLRDPEEPEQELIHPVQMQYLTNFIQSWLNECEKPLVDLYQYLHYYCQSLRLQILLEQAHRIGNQGVKQKDLHISNYTACKSFTIEYWKDYCANVNAQNSSNPSKKQVVGTKGLDIGMTIVCDEEGIFHVQHWPPLPIDDSVAILQILKKPIFTMEEILNRTIYARCQRRFEELRETILPTALGNFHIDPSIPALICEFLPDSTPEEVLFISISPYSGLYKVVSYMETRYCQQIENALNRDQTNLIEPINSLKIWLIQQRIPSLLAHLNYRIHTRIPSINLKNERIAPFLNTSLAIELPHHEGFYVLIHISDIDQLLIEYYLLIVEKRGSSHEPLVLQQQTSDQPPTASNDEGAKWILEPLTLCPLDPTTFLRKELFEFKDAFQHKRTTVDEEDADDDDDERIKRAQATSIHSLKSLVKFVSYYDEMLSFIFFKDNLQRKTALCKNVLYCSWSGIPYLDIVRRTSTNNESNASNSELDNYVNDYFWARLQSCSVRLTYTLRDSNREHKSVDRQWTTSLNLSTNNYFRNAFIKTPYNALTVHTHTSTKTYSKIVESVLNDFRSAVELTYIFENYSPALLEAIDLHAISKLVFFNFFKCVLQYGPDFAFSVTLTYNSNPAQSESNSSIEKLFDLRFSTIKPTFLTASHQILNRKLLLFLNQTRSLKQFLRLLHMTAIPISSIARLNCFNRPIVFTSQGGCVQSLLTFVPYTESRWRLIFGQIFALDIQICGPNLILVRDGSFTVQLNSSLADLSTIPRLKEFLSTYADDRGLNYEFSDITENFHEQDFLLPEMKISLPPSSLTSQSAGESSAYSSLMDTTSHSPMKSPSNIYDVIFRDSLPITAATNSSNSQTYQTDRPAVSTLHGYNHELLTKANYPVYMSQQTFFRMLYAPDGHPWSKLESFLASSILIRQFAKGVTEPFDANNLTVRSQSGEQDTYRIEHLLLQVSFTFDIPTAIYRIQFVSLFDPSASSQQSANDPWSSDELQNMNRFLNENFFPLNPFTNTATPSIDILSLQASQNLNTAMGSFERMLSLIERRILKDLVKIIGLELNPEGHHLWRARWCLTIPQGNGFSQVGQPGIYYHSSRSSFLFMFQFTSRPSQSDGSTNSSPKTAFVVPLIHDTVNNQTTLWDGSSKHPTMGHESKYQAITKILTAFKETINKHECSLYQTVLELITRLQVSPTSNNP